jgi:hypothetical protein
VRNIQQPRRKQTMQKRKRHSTSTSLLGTSIAKHCLSNSMTTTILMSLSTSQKRKECPFRERVHEDMSRILSHIYHSHYSLLLPTATTQEGGSQSTQVPA